MAPSPPLPPVPSLDQRRNPASMPHPVGAAAATRATSAGGWLARHAAEPDMRRRRLDRLPLPGGRPVAEAVVRRAEKRAALHHPARDVGVRTLHVVAVGSGDLRVTGQAAGGRAAVGVTGCEEVGGPFPHVAGHLEQAEPIRRVPLDRLGAWPGGWAEIPPGELAPPGVGHRRTVRLELIPPAVYGAVQA